MYVDKFVVKIRSQFLFWYIRNHLISLQVEAIATELDALDEDNLLPGQHKRNKKKLNKKLEALRFAQNNPTTRGTFGKSFVIEQLSLIDESVKFEGVIEHVLKGTRQIGKVYLAILERMIPGCRNAFENGPNDLFKVLYSESLPEALEVLSESILEAVSTSGTVNHNVKATVQSTLQISGITAIFSTSLRVFEGIAEVIDTLFPANNWDKFNTFPASDISNGEMFVLEGVPTDMLSANKAATILLSYAYIRACYLGDENYLSAICFKAKCLQILQSEFMIKENQWFWVDKTVKNERLSLPGMQIRRAFSSVRPEIKPPILAQSVTL